LWDADSSLTNFGINLTAENIQSENFKTRADLKKYMRENPNIASQFID